MSDKLEKEYFLVRYCNDQKETVEKADLDRIYRAGRPVFEIVRLPKEKNG